MNKENQPSTHMKSKEEILDKHYQKGMHWSSVNRKNVLSAMQAYHDQFAIGVASFHEQDDRFYCSHCQQPIKPVSSPAPIQQVKGEEAMGWDYCHQCRKVVIGIPVGENDEYDYIECPECESITSKVDVSEVYKWLASQPAEAQQDNEKDLAYAALTDQVQFLAGKVIARDKEIERLKGLIEKAVIYGMMEAGCGTTLTYDEAVQEFKTENKL